MNKNPATEVQREELRILSTWQGPADPDRSAASCQVDLNHGYNSHGDLLRILNVTLTLYASGKGPGLRRFAPLLRPAECAMAR